MREMKAADRSGKILKEDNGQDRFLKVLYENPLGRGLVKILIQPKISELGGRLLDSPVSKLGIKPFIKHNHIPMGEYENKKYKSYNDFFCRKIKPGARKIDGNPKHFIAPCDGRLSVYPIAKDGTYKIKDTEYTIRSLTRSKKIEKYFEGGYLFIYRLTVEDYHRYCYVDEGHKYKNYRIEGVFHTVNPIANDKYPIYKENTREFSLLKSKNFKTLLMMEVGALMVGRIVNNHQERDVCRGEEKGRFEFGGSTVILCVKKHVVKPDEDILKNTENGIETLVKMGEKTGIRI